MANVTETMTVAQYRQAVSSLKPAAPGNRPAALRRNKYGAARTHIGDEVFDSRKESRTYSELLMAMKAQEDSQRVVRLERSKRFELIPKQAGERACTYVADFEVEYADGRVEVIDTKSDITRKNPLYVVKRKLMLVRFGIRICEV